MSIKLDLNWIQQTWQKSKLGDARRNARAVKIAERILDKPNVGFPTLMQNWADLKAAYRLFNEDDVTHEALQEMHWNEVKRQASECKNVVLWIQDGRELDFTDHEETENLGPIGNHRGRGIMMHSCLTIQYDAKNPIILGLGHQKAWIRENISKIRMETKGQRNKRSTEAKIWSEMITAIGRPPREECKWVTIGDRGSDIFEFIDTCKKNNWDAVIRVCQNRLIKIEDKQEYLVPWIRSLKSQITKVIEIRGKDGKAKRETTLNVSWGKATVLPPAIREKKFAPIEAWYIRCWNEAEGIEWILHSSIPVVSVEDASEKIDWYKCRWIIEEYHKCLKTGCGIEKRQSRSAGALLAILGFLGVIATKLLELRSISREEKDISITGRVPETLIKIVCARYKLKEELSAREFWRRVAMLGGFIGRRSDGDPGWQTLWNGWLRILDMSYGAELMKCG